MGLTGDDAADVFQETFLALYRNLDRISDPQSLPKWLSVTAARSSLMILRMKSTRPTQSLSDASLEDVLAEEDSKSEQVALDSLETETARKALDQLPDRCKSLLGALFDDGFDNYEAVAENLGIPRGAIGPTRARCLEKLRSILKKQGFFE
jgi:RNA polymerase sigma factor (sigma-70 family)